jgi:hypothetical protein
MLDLIPVDIPSGPWLDRLRPNNWVWLDKEQQPAQVLMSFEPIVDMLCDSRMGRIALLRLSQDGQMSSVECWEVSYDGHGHDGSVLMRPCLGQLPEHPAPLPAPEWRRLTLSNLRNREEIMAMHVRMLDDQLCRLGLAAALSQLHCEVFGEELPEIDTILDNAIQARCDRRTAAQDLHDFAASARASADQDPTDIQLAEIDADPVPIPDDVIRDFAAESDELDSEEHGYRAGSAAAP